ncbi:MAG: TRAP transporter large permease subunit [Rhodobacteraceae bacterium]|nr:TRAP transporter large permease subunit [Paracoccaceae bacterium]
MFFGLDGVEISLIVVLLCLFGGIMTGFPVAFAIGGAGVLAFGILAGLDSAGLLVHRAVDTASPAYHALLGQGVNPLAISHFRYPDLPRIDQPLFPGGWELAMDRNLSFIVNRMNERVFAGQGIETLLAVLMFVMMGITLERSRIANDLLTSMARVFGPMPGGLAVSVVVVGAFLAASTGIVGATVVTMGLLSLPTMLRNRYSPELATGVIAASGTLGQIIPPSIVIVLLGTLAGDIYATAQETRAITVGCPDALTYLGKAAVLSVGTLFQSALLPGILLAVLYAVYAFGFALFDPRHAPPVRGEVASGPGGEVVTRGEALTWLVGVPVGLVAAVVLAAQVGIVGSQDLTVDTVSSAAPSATLRTNVPEQCKAAMIALHGQAAWDRAEAEQARIAASGAEVRSHALSPEEIAAARGARIAGAPPLGTGITALFLLVALVLAGGRGTAPSRAGAPIWIGFAGVGLGLVADWLLIAPTTSAGATAVILLVPAGLALYGCREAASGLARNPLVRVVFPPLLLIVAVLGSILGGITNPTPAAALGAAGAIMLAAHRRLTDDNRSGRIIVWAAFSIVIMILVGASFDLRVNLPGTRAEQYIAFAVAQAAYHFAVFGILYSCWVLLRAGVLGPVVRETAKVTSMVFTILIGSQILNLVVISFGGETYIQDFLRSFDSETAVFLIVMLVLFILGFVLDFLEIVYIVVPIVGPVIYGGTMDPKWVTIMIAVNLQTSFLTPPFGFALFYLRGVAPSEVTTAQIYRGVVPFVLIQIAALLLLWLVPGVVTIVPALLGR